MAAIICVPSTGAAKAVRVAAGRPQCLIDPGTAVRLIIADSVDGHVIGGYVGGQEARHKILKSGK
jgi:hypothetical protein